MEIEVSLSQLRQGQPVSELTPDQIRRIAAYTTTLRQQGVSCCKSLEAVELNHMRDQHPEYDLQVWEAMTATLVAFRQRYPQYDSEAVFTSLLLLSLSVNPMEIHFDGGKKGRITGTTTGGTKRVNGMKQMHYKELERMYRERGSKVTPLAECPDQRRVDWGLINGSYYLPKWSDN